MNNRFLFFVGYFLILGCTVQASSLSQKGNDENEAPKGIIPSKRGIPYRQSNAEQLGLTEAWKADIKRDFVRYVEFLVKNPDSESAYLQSEYKRKFNQLMKPHRKPGTREDVDFWIREQYSKQAIRFAYQKLLQKHNWEHGSSLSAASSTSIW